MALLRSASARNRTFTMGVSCATRPERASVSGEDRLAAVPRCAFLPPTSRFGEQGTHQCQLGLQGSTQWRRKPLRAEEARNSDRSSQEIHHAGMHGRSNPERFASRQRNSCRPALRCIPLPCLSLIVLPSGEKESRCHRADNKISRESQCRKPCECNGLGCVQSSKRVHDGEPHLYLVSRSARHAACLALEIVGRSIQQSHSRQKQASLTASEAARIVRLS